MVVEWLAQPITLPLWGFLVALILPMAYFARLARQVVKKRLGGEIE